MPPIGLIYSGLSSGLFIGAEGLASWAGCYTLWGQGSAFIYSPAAIELRIQSLSLCTCACLPCAADTAVGGKGKTEKMKGEMGWFISVRELVLGWCNTAGPCYSQTGASPAYKSSNPIVNLSPSKTSPYLTGKQYTLRGYRRQSSYLPIKKDTLKWTCFFNFPPLRCGQL